MIRAFQEPKLLPSDAKPIWDRRRVSKDTRTAITGSARLRDAIRGALGLDPWRDPPKPDSHPKVARRPKPRSRGDRLWKVRVARRSKILGVQRAVCKHFSISIGDLIGQRGSIELCRQRHIALAVARITTKASYPDIGICFNRDHSTVMYGCAKISEADADVIAICAKLAR